jgi:fumarylacetoacetate (FAA) hydrolase
MEAEVTVVTGDVRHGCHARRLRRSQVRLVMLVNDVIAAPPDSGGTGQGFRLPAVQAGQRPSAPVAVTPDELGDAWHDSKAAPALAWFDLNGELHLASRTPDST